MGAVPSRLDEILERDGGACVWCGREPWRADLTLEHLLPRSRGGRSTPENLLVACRTCNRRRGSRPAGAFARQQHAPGTPDTRTDVLAAALGRLAGSCLRAHAEYGRRQLSLLSGYTASSTEP